MSRWRNHPWLRQKLQNKDLHRRELFINFGVDVDLRFTSISFVLSYNVRQLRRHVLAYYISILEHASYPHEQYSRKTQYDCCSLTFYSNYTHFEEPLYREILARKSDDATIFCFFILVMLTTFASYDPRRSQGRTPACPRPPSMPPTTLYSVLAV